MVLLVRTRDAVKDEKEVCVDNKIIFARDLSLLVRRRREQLLQDVVDFVHGKGVGNKGADEGCDDERRHRVALGHEDEAADGGLDALVKHL